MFRSTGDIIVANASPVERNIPNVQRNIPNVPRDIWNVPRDIWNVPPKYTTALEANRPGRVVFVHNTLVMYTCACTPVGPPY
jgi:hypothetical protein